MVERGRVFPSLPERPGQIGDSRATYLQLDVMPRWARSIAGIEVDRLRVTIVGLVVAPAVTQVDPTDEGDIVIRRIRVAGDEQFLVVASVASHPLVEQDLTAGFVHRVDEMEVLLLTEMRLIGVGAPHETSDDDASGGQPGEDPCNLRPRSSEPFVRIPPPVREINRPARP